MFRAISSVVAAVLLSPAVWASTIVVDFEEFSIGDGPASWGYGGIDYIYSKGYRIAGGTIAGPADVFVGTNTTQVFGDDIAGLGPDGFGVGVQIIVERADGGVFEVYDVDALLQIDMAGSSSISGSVAGGGLVTTSTAYGTGDWLNIDQLVFNAVGNGFGVGSASAEIDNIELSVVPLPAVIWLFGSALLSLVLVRRRFY